MRRKVLIRFVFSVFGMLIGYVLTKGVLELLAYLFELEPVRWLNFTLYSGIIIIFAVVFYCISLSLYGLLSAKLKGLVQRISEVPVYRTVSIIIGLLVSLAASFFIVTPITTLIQSKVISIMVALVIYILFAWICVSIFNRCSKELMNYFSRLRVEKSQVEDESENHHTEHHSRRSWLKPTTESVIIDTSVLIDGRIIALMKTGFLSESYIIPSMDAELLKRMADCGDTIKRAKGRRGLDVIDKLLKEFPDSVRLSDMHVEENADEDAQLLLLAEAKHCGLLTMDFNLCKVARLRSVRVLNINELYSAVKIALAVGDTLTVTVSKKGRQEGQGVAYLEDGTMIIVENGEPYVGSNVEVTISSTSQTGAGTLFFAIAGE